MSNITKYSPFRALGRIEPFGRDFDDMFKGFFMTPVQFNQDNAGEFPIDVTEDERNYKLRAEIPGFRKEEIQIAIDGDQVTITAEMKRDKEGKKGDQIVFKECYEGKLYRSFSLPHPVDDRECTASYADGVLELTMPKKAPVATRKIRVD